MLVEEILDMILNSQDGDYVIQVQGLQACNPQAGTFIVVFGSALQLEID